MIVLSYGMTKSGSTLAFELCRGILEIRGFPQRRLPYPIIQGEHTVSFMVNPEVERLRLAEQAVARDETLVIKLHGPLLPDTLAHIKAGVAARRLRVHVNYRDPREVCLSLLDAGVASRQREPLAVKGFGTIHTLDEAIAFTARQMSHCQLWAGIPGALLLYYNAVAFERAGVVAAMCADLGLPLLDEGELSALEQRLESAHTQKNKAVRDRHRQDFSAAQNRYVLDALPAARDFIAYACEARDTAWMRTQWALR